MTRFGWSSEPCCSRAQQVALQPGSLRPSAVPGLQRLVSLGHDLTRHQCRAAGSVGGGESATCAGGACACLVPPVHPICMHMMRAKHSPTAASLPQRPWRSACMTPTRSVAPVIHPGQRLNQQRNHRHAPKTVAPARVHAFSSIHPKRMTPRGGFILAPPPKHTHIVTHPECRCCPVGMAVDPPALLHPSTRPLLRPMSRLPAPPPPRPLQALHHPAAAWCSPLLDELAIREQRRGGGQQQGRGGAHTAAGQWRPCRTPERAWGACAKGGRLGAKARLAAVRRGRLGAKAGLAAVGADGLHYASDAEGEGRYPPGERICCRACKFKFRVAQVQSSWWLPVNALFPMDTLKALPRTKSIMHIP
jgi:hypothetical protein